MDRIQKKVKYDDPDDDVHDRLYKSRGIDQEEDDEDDGDNQVNRFNCLYNIFRVQLMLLPKSLMLKT